MNHPRNYFGSYGFTATLEIKLNYTGITGKTEEFTHLLIYQNSIIFKLLVKVIRLVVVNVMVLLTRQRSTAQ